jgi:hypothetical protein
MTNSNNLMDMKRGIGNTPLPNKRARTKSVLSAFFYSNTSSFVNFVNTRLFGVESGE